MTSFLQPGIMSSRWLAPTTALVCGILFSSRVAAQVDPSLVSSSLSQPEDTKPPWSPAATAAHPWLYLEQPEVPALYQTITTARVTDTSSGVSPTRPFASSLATTGTLAELGAESGLLPNLSLQAMGLQGGFREIGVPSSSGLMAGLRWAPLGTLGSATHVVLSGGVLRDLTGQSGSWARIAVSQDIGRIRLASTVHGEHVFAPGRDGMDVMVMTGASYHITGPLRAGVEYVAQDVEEAFGDEADGGIRHFAGPTASIELLDRRLTLSGGPAFGLSYRSPQLLSRIALACSF